MILDGKFPSHKLAKPPRSKGWRRLCLALSSLALSSFCQPFALNALAQPDPRTLDPAIHLKKARKLASVKKYKEALQEINKALFGNAHYWEAWYEGAYIYQLQGRRKEAIAKYSKLLDLKPDYTEARINLGSLLRHDGKFQQAESQYKKVIASQYYNFDAHYNLANTLIDEDKLDEAIKELKLCVKLSPSDASAHNNLGVIFQRSAYLEDAAEEFERASNLDPANKKYLDNLNMVRSELSEKKNNSGNQNSEKPAPGKSPQDRPSPETTS